MKKIISLVLCLVMLVSCFSFSAFAQDEISIIINGKKLTMDQNPVIIDGRTLVPVRAIFEGLGAQVEWDDSVKTAIGKRDGKEIKIQINNTVAKVNGADITLDVPAQLINSRTMVPVRFISEALGEKVDWDGNTKTVIITSEEKVLFEQNFDAKTEMVENKDYVAGAAYPVSGLSITNEVDHTTGNGKSLKFAGRQKKEHRIKFKNAFEGAIVGETYVFSAWVYTGVDGHVAINAYGDTGTEYAYKSAAGKSAEVKAKTWTKVEAEYTYDNTEIVQVGIEQPLGASLIDTIYIDDVKVEKKSTAAKPEKTTLVPVIEKEGRRPIPAPQVEGKGYDDLIFYEREFETEDASKKLTSEEMFALLPTDAQVMADHSDMVNASVMGKEYMTIETVKAEGMPFSEAINAKVSVIPTVPYHSQLVLKSLDDNSFEDGDNMLVTFYMRTIKSQNEFNIGRVQLIVEQEQAPNDKVLKEDVKTNANGQWKKVYLPFTAKKGHTRLCIRLGYYIQEVEFGGYEIRNYKDVPIENLPTDTVMETYDKKELFDKNVQWRHDAWNRIEQIRKGDFKVVVKDASGNVIENAKVNVNMYDHEFKWGTAINGTYKKGDATGEKYKEAISTFFNTGVAESAHKPVEYMTKPDHAKDKVRVAKEELGLKYFRGHTFVWDQHLVRTYNVEKGEWIKNTKVSEELALLTIANDEAGVDKYIENSIKTVAEGLKGQMIEWDVVNEPLDNREIRSRFGNGVFNKWFAWAKKYVPDAKLYINETGIVGDPGNNRNQGFMQLLDYMVESGVEFDGIGSQGHFGAYVSPKAFYDEMMLLAKYGKEMKITEFDMDLPMHDDEEAEASFMRDIMILMFSIEQMDGFVMWGFWDGSHWLNNAPLFTKDWKLKKSGEQYIDLVYNKWLTKEEGITGKDGAYNVRGFYGDYDVTVSANGKTKTVTASFNKNSNNTLEVVID
ncbi:MAG: hypothetical protein E7391_05010 [Ruminococcaceae bacterium]|nr:hypothetical protein [Oscillospiraceae bacterium]